MRRILSRLASRRSAFGIATASGSAVLGSIALASDLGSDEYQFEPKTIPDSNADSATNSNRMVDTISIADFGASASLKDNKAPIESAVKESLASGRSVRVPTGTFRYSQIDFGANDAVKPSRLVIEGRGTLLSTHRGTSIIASKGAFYDLVIDGPRFESVAGAGTTLIDGDRFIRLVIAPGTQINDFDWVIRGEQYLQSLRVLGAIIRGGHGAVIKAPMAFDCTFAHNIIEFVTDGIVIDGNHDPAVHTCRIDDNLIEGIGGRAIVLGTCLATSVSRNYLEGNQTADILLNAGRAPHKGLKIQNNSIQMSPTRMERREYGVVWGASTSLPTRAGGNFCSGPLHDTAETTALIDMTGDFSAVELYRGYRAETFTGRAPIGRTIYNDGLSQHFSWFNRYLSLDPHANEVRFGGEHLSEVNSELEPPVLTFGTSSPSEDPSLYPRKRWARGSVIFNAKPADGNTFAWICLCAGTPGEWLSVPLNSA